MHRSGPNRLDAVTIRIGLADAQTEQAVTAFGLHGLTASQSTLHLIDFRPGAAPSSLASTGVTISLEDRSDLSLLTVQVRHVRQTQLHPRWGAFYDQDGETMRIEEECDSTRRVLTASLAAQGEHPARELIDADLRLADLLTPRQWSFLEDCAPGSPPPAPISLFGPIPALSWTIALDRVDATVSLWKLPAAGTRTRLGLDLMEVSRRSVPAEAGFLYPALAASIRRRGLDPDAGIPWLETRAARWLGDTMQTTGVPVGTSPKRATRGRVTFARMAGPSARPAACLARRRGGEE